MFNFIGVKIKKYKKIIFFLKYLFFFSYIVIQYIAELKNITTIYGGIIFYFNKRSMEIRKYGESNKKKWRSS